MREPLPLPLHCLFTMRTSRILRFPLGWAAKHFHLLDREVFGDGAVSSLHLFAHPLIDRKIFSILPNNIEEIHNAQTRIRHRFYSTSFQEEAALVECSVPGGVF